MVKVIEQEAGEVAIDANGIYPIPGSKCLRTIDVLDLCPRACPPHGHHLGDLVHITYCTIWAPEAGHQKAIRIIVFIGNMGTKQLHKYPEAVTIFKLKALFGEGFQTTLGCDPQLMAEAVHEHNPW
jgi:hypothetical protein